MKITALAGGVGGAKLVDGLAHVLPPNDLTVIVNTADDFDHFGLHISPDLDTVCYTLAGLANPVTGWGREAETWKAMDVIARLGGPNWFHLGDMDLGVHLERTRRLRNGQPLSQIVRDFCASWSIEVRVLPMSDEPVTTQVVTSDMGTLTFQEYFVRHQFQPQVRAFTFQGADQSKPAPGVLQALREADIVVICPSNPWVSVGPILAVPGIQEEIHQKPVVAVSPIVGGKAIKGPAAKMYQELGLDPSAITVARHYGNLLAGFILDVVDADQAGIIDQSGIISLVTQTIMLTPEDRRRLAAEVIYFCEQFPRRVDHP